MISESLPGTLEVPRKSQIRESFGPVQRNAMPTAPARAPAMISKVGHLGAGGAAAGGVSKIRHLGAGGAGAGWGLELERFQLLKESIAPWFRNPTRLAFNHAEPKEVRFLRQKL